MNEKKPTSALAKKLAEEKEKDGIKINQRNMRFNFNAEKPRITYARQRIIFE